MRRDHTAGFASTDGKWHHIAVTWTSDSGATKLYDDGRLAWQVCRVVNSRRAETRRFACGSTLRSRSTAMRIRLCDWKICVLCDLRSRAGVEIDADGLHLQVTRGRGRVIPSGGTLVVGREQDCQGGCFDSASGRANVLMFSRAVGITICGDSCCAAQEPWGSSTRSTTRSTALRTSSARWVHANCSICAASHGVPSCLLAIPPVSMVP